MTNFYKIGIKQKLLTCTFILTINIINFATPTLRYLKKLNTNRYNFACLASIFSNLVAIES